MIALAMDDRPLFLGNCLVRIDQSVCKVAKEQQRMRAVKSMSFPGSAYFISQCVYFETQFKQSIQLFSSYSGIFCMINLRCTLGQCNDSVRVW